MQLQLFKPSFIMLSKYKVDCVRPKLNDKRLRDEKFVFLFYAENVSHQKKMLHKTFFSISIGKNVLISFKISLRDELYFVGLVAALKMLNAEYWGYFS